MNKTMIFNFLFSFSSLNGLSMLIYNEKRISAQQFFLTTLDFLYSIIELFPSIFTDFHFHDSPIGGDIIQFRNTREKKNS